MVCAGIGAIASAVCLSGRLVIIRYLKSGHGLIGSLHGPFEFSASSWHLRRFLMHVYAAGGFCCFRKYFYKPPGLRKRLKSSSSISATSYTRPRRHPRVWPGMPAPPRVQENVEAATRVSRKKQMQLFAAVAGIFCRHLVRPS